MTDREQVLQDIGDRIRIMRTGARLTQRDLAGKAGVTQSQVSEIECGKAGSVQIGTLIRYAEALGTTLAHLVAGENTDPPAAEAPPQVEMTVSRSNGTVTLKANGPMLDVTAEAMRRFRELTGLGADGPIGQYS